MLAKKSSKKFKVKTWTIAIDLKSLKFVVGQAFSNLKALKSYEGVFDKESSWLMVSEEHQV